MHLLVSFVIMLFRSSSALRTAGVGSLLSCSFLPKRSKAESTKVHRSYVSMSGEGSETLIKNPLLSPSRLPLFTDISPADVNPAVEFHLNKLHENFDQFEKKINEIKDKPNYTTLIEEYERLQFPLSFTWGIVSHLMSVKNSDDLRKAHESLQPKIVQTYQKLGQSKVIYDALVNLKKDPVLWGSLEEAQQRIINSSIHSMVSGGVGLEGETKEKFNKLQLTLAELSTKFSNNILDSTKEFKLVLTDKALIKGLPGSAVSFAVQQVCYLPIRLHAIIVNCITVAMFN